MSSVQNELENEIIITTYTTARRILATKDGGDAFALYHFYAYTATRQRTNSVKATDTFCMNGLGWGKTRFYRAKKILQELGVVEQVDRHVDGRFQGHYILIKYLQGNYYSPENRRVEKQESVKTETNTNKENRNTNKKNINAVTPDAKNVTEEYLIELNSLFPSIDVGYEWEKAQDYVKGSGKRYKDMRAFFRNWLRRTQEGSKGRKAGGVYVE